MRIIITECGHKQITLELIYTQKHLHEETNTKEETAIYLHYN